MQSTKWDFMVKSRNGLLIIVCQDSFEIVICYDLVMKGDGFRIASTKKTLPT